jgi:hypothetical protein
MNLIYLALSLSGISILASMVCLWSIGRTTPTALKNRLDEQEAYLDKLCEWYKKLNMNVARIGRKATNPGENENGATEGIDDTFKMKPGETPDQWKHRMRIELAAGKLTHR